jgi:hypothetical protein
MKILLVGDEFYADGQTDGYNDAHSGVSQFF